MASILSVDPAAGDRGRAPRDPRDLPWNLLITRAAPPSVSSHPSCRASRGAGERIWICEGIVCTVVLVHVSHPATRSRRSFFRGYPWC